jgi:glycosyltransferase involved in cell wall biosynthesis
MKIAVILGNLSVSARPLNFKKLFESDRGLTGTDLSAVMICKELALLNNDVSFFTLFTDDGVVDTWENVKVYDVSKKNEIIDNSFDAVISINDPNDLIELNTNAIRLCWQFLNDFGYCQPNFDEYVNIWLGVSEQHIEYLKSQNNTTHSKWQLVPLGCDPSIYEDKRVDGRVIWTSSPDRGLHLLLQQWAEIKKAVPNASLKIFYHFNFDLINQISDAEPVHIRDIAQRLRYIKNAIPKLKKLDVEHIGSVSRNEIAKQYSEASVFAFSCDTVSFSEGFSVSTMEAHASYTVPVVIGTDCLGTVYKNSGCVMIDPPGLVSVKKFTNEVIKALKNKQHSNDVINNCREFAKKHSWKEIAKKIQKVIENG